MVLVVVAKKIATHKGFEVIERLTAGVERWVVVVTTVGQISAKIKQLKRTQHGRNHPKQHQVFPRKPQFKHVVSNSHEQNLPHRNVFFGKSQKPQKEIGVAIVVIGVVGGGGVAVVQVVFGTQRFEVVECKKRRTQKAQPVVKSLVLRHYHAVYRVVGGNEHARVEVHLQQNKQISKRILPVDVVMEQQRQRQKPQPQHG